MPQCEGWRRYGGAFTVGGVPRWEQCKEEAMVMIEFEQTNQGGQEKGTLPACPYCWIEATETKGITIISVTPIKKEG